MFRPLAGFTAFFICLAFARISNRLVAADNELDPGFDLSSGVTFADGTPGEIVTVVVQKDGKVLLGGYFHRVSGSTQSGIARLNADGTMDKSFVATLKPGALETINAIALQPDGKILVGGNFVTLDASQRQTIVARLNSDGTLDDSFTPPTLVSGLRAMVQSIALVNGDRIMIGGSFSDARTLGGPPYGLLRLRSDGSVDATFLGSVHSLDRNAGYRSPGFVNAIVPQPDGALLVSGGFISVNSRNFNDPGYGVGGFVRFDERGRPDTGFRPIGFELGSVGCTLPCQSLPVANGSVTAMALQPNGGILVGRQGGLINDSGPPACFERLHSDGAIDSQFRVIDLNAQTVDAIALQEDGRIVIGGRLTEIGGVARSGIARLNSDGTLDDWMATSGVSSGARVRCIAVQPDGRIIIAGDFTTVCGVKRAGLARLLAALPGLRLMRPQVEQEVFSTSLIASNGKRYTLESKDSLSDPTWISRASVIGDATQKVLTDRPIDVSQRFYRVAEQPSQ